MPIDPDDVEHICLDYAVRDFVEAASKLSDPRCAWLDLAALVTAAACSPHNAEVPFRRILLAALRRTRAEILVGL
jgi:hypothetical protein